MSDIEITRLCAEATGYRAFERQPSYPPNTVTATADGTLINSFCYDPLHDDAQAMALVKRLKLEPRFNATKEAWFVTESYSQRIVAWNTDLNRAICECVARMAEQGKGGV